MVFNQYKSVNLKNNMINLLTLKNIRLKKYYFLNSTAEQVDKNYLSHQFNLKLPKKINYFFNW